MKTLSALLAGFNPVVMYVLIGVLAVLVLALVAYEVARNIYKRKHRSGEGKFVPERKEASPSEEPEAEPAASEEPVAEEPAPEPAAEAEPETPSVPAEEPAPAESPEHVSAVPVPQPPEATEPVPENAKVVFAPANRLVSVRYDKSFTARLMQTSEKNKEYYNQIKNELLRYKRVKSRISWRRESFRLGRELVAKLEIRGKTLCLYLALNSADYAETKYFVEDASDKKMNLPVPTLYRIKSDRRARYALDLIADVFKTRETKYTETEPVDFAADYPYEETLALVEKELVKIIEVRSGVNDEFDDEDDELNDEDEKDSGVSVAEAGREMRDDEAEKLVRESGNVTMRGKQTIVNVDTLGEYFSDGETVTFDDMKERIPFLNKSAVCVKVLARGRLNKALVVEADDFSLDAVKMIVLAGGTVYRKRSE